MKIQKVTIENLGNIKNASLDLAQLGKSIISVSGKNGSGKTHFIEAMLPLWAYLRSPSYKESIQEHFSPAGSSLEVDFHIGGDYRARIRGVRGKTPQAYLFSIQGGIEVPIAGPQVTEYRASVEALFPYPQELVYSSVFAAQKDIRGLFSLDSVKRQAAIASLLGLEEYRKLVLFCNKQKDKLIERIDYLTDSLDKINIPTAEGYKTVEQYEADLEDINIELLSLREALGGVSSTLSANKMEYSQIEEIHLPKLVKQSLKIRNEISLLSGKNEKSSYLKDRLSEVQSGVMELNSKLNGLVKALDWVSVRIDNLKGELIKINQKQIQFNIIESRVNVSNPMCAVCPLVADTNYDPIRHEWARQELNVLLASKTALNEEVGLTRSAIDTQKINESELHVALSRALAIEQIGEQSTDKLNEELASISLEENELRNKLRGLSIVMVEQEDRIVQFNENIRSLVSQRDDIITKIAQIRNLNSSLALRASMFADRDKEIYNVEDFEILADLAKKEELNQITTIGPLIEQTVNGLLAGYRNGEFEVRLSPSEELKSGEIRDRLNPEILKWGDRQGNVSPGEQGIIGEALRTAISMEIAKMAGMGTGLTIIRDEATAALDPEAAIVYMNILRESMKSDLFFQTIIVCHQQHVNEMADVCIEMADGKVMLGP